MRFSKGIHKDQHESRQPEGTYRDAMNMILDDERGALRNEAGTTEIDGISTNYVVIGSTLLSDGRTALISRYVAPFTYVLTFTYVGPALPDDLISIVIDGVSYISTTTPGDTSASIDEWIDDEEAKLAALDNPISLERTATNKLTLTCGVALTITDESTGWSFTQSSEGQTTTSQIGIFNGVSYMSILSDNGWATANKLDLGPIIEMTSKINHNDDYIIYWTDNLNPPRYLNVDSDDGLERSSDSLTLFPTIEKHPYFQFDRLVAGGSLGVGTYNIALSYVNTDGSQTGWFYVSHPISVNDNTDRTLPDQYDGNEDDYPTNRAIQFTVTNVDTTYQYIRVALVDGSDVKVIPDRVISLDVDGRQTFVITGNEAYTIGSLEEIVIPMAYYTKARTLRQVDDRLYLGNVEVLNNEFDYQKYANNIVVSVVEEDFDIVTGLGYKDNQFSFTNKSFRRDEIYALYVSWVLKDGSETKAFHIPGRGSSEDDSGKSSGYIRFDNDAPTSIRPASLRVVLKPGWYSSVPSTHTLSIIGATALGVDAADASWDINIMAGATSADVVHSYITSVIDTAGITWKNNILITADPDDPNAFYVTNKTGNNEDWNGVEFSVTASPKDGLVISAYGGGVFLADGEDDEGELLDAATIEFYGESVTHNVNGNESKADLAINCAAALVLNATIAADYDIAVDGTDATKVNIIAKVVGAPPDQFNSPIVLSYDVSDPFVVVGFGVGGGNEFYAANETVSMVTLAADSTANPYVGRIVEAFNIPGGAYDDAKLFHFSGAADSATGMGYWENANEEYPSTDDWDVWDVSAGTGFNTGRTLRSAKVRHHRFPDNFSNTFFDGTDTDNNATALGFQLTNVKIPNDLAAEVIGFKVYYAKRTDNNKTILDQGQFIYQGVDISVIGSEFYFSQNKASDPAVSNSYSQTVGAIYGFNMLRKYPDISLANVDFVKSQAQIDDALTSNRVGIGSYIPEAIPRVRAVSAKSYIAEGDTIDLTGGGFTYNTYENDPGVSKILLELNAALHGAGETTVLTVSGTSGTLSVEIEGVLYDEVFDTDADTTATNWVTTHAATLAVLSPAITATDTGIAEITLGSTSDIMVSNSSPGDIGFTITTGYDSQSNHLINLCSFKLDIYSSFTEQDLVWTGHFQETVDAENNPFDSVTSWHAANQTPAIYGGDTFISKYTFKEHMDEGASTFTTYSHDIVCESDDNIGFRHEGSEQYKVYYPKTDRSTFLDPGVYPTGGDTYDVDNPTDYNSEFSELQDWKVSFPYDGTEPDPIFHPTRVVRSQSSDGTTKDHFRRFLVDDYKDFPRQRGVLVHLANMGSVIIAHMTRGLYRTRGKEELSFSDVRAFVGSGDIFSVEPIEIGSTEIGLGGLQDQRAAIVTTTGYYWIDRLAKRVYAIADSGLKDITGGLTYWMQNNLDSMGTLHLNEDMAENRVLITGYGSSLETTLSMDQATNTWTSFHSYVPQWYFTTPNRCYSIAASGIHRHHVGDYGSFYGVEYDSYIDFIDNDPPGKMKQVAYMVFDTVIDDNGVEQKDITFSNYRVTNSYQDTGTVVIDTSVSFSSSTGNARRHRGFWRLNVNRDTLNIPATAALRRYGTTQAYQKRLIDRWHKTRLTMDNSANLLLYLFHAQLMSRQSKR